MEAMWGHSKFWFGMKGLVNIKAKKRGMQVFSLVKEELILNSTFID